MKIRIRSVLRSIVSLSMLGVLFACHKEEVTGPPELSGITPATGYAGDTVVISGAHFNELPGTNTVAFNGTPATVVAATQTSLKVVVPTGATNGKVVVTTNGKAVTSTSDFTVLTSVYIAGFVNAADNATAVATYWQDGVKTQLPGVAGSTYLYSVFVHGKDIYYTGIYNDNVNNIDNVAAYWKNGVITKLNDGNSSSARATSIYVTPEGDVYVGGTYEGAVAYWKNGVLKLLTDGTTSCQVNSIAVSGSDVYIGGAEASNGGPILAKYWKNGTEKILSAGKQFAIVRSIAVLDGNVHVAGYKGNDAVYWKNDAPTILPRQDADDAVAFGMYVSGNDVYIAGSIEKGPDTFAVYWKNGVETILPDGVAALGVFVHGTDLYLTGADSHNKALYWKNQVPTALTDGKTLAAGYAIAVR